MSISAWCLDVGSLVIGTSATRGVCKEVNGFEGGKREGVVR